MQTQRDLTNDGHPHFCLYVDDERTYWVDATESWRRIDQRGSLIVQNRLWRRFVIPPEGLAQTREQRLAALMHNAKASWRDKPSRNDRWEFYVSFRMSPRKVQTVKLRAKNLNLNTDQEIVVIEIAD